MRVQETRAPKTYRELKRQMYEEVCMIRLCESTGLNKIKIITVNSRLARHPAITDTRYYGKKPDPRQKL